MNLATSEIEQRYSLATQAPYLHRKAYLGQKDFKHKDSSSSEVSPQSNLPSQTWCNCYKVFCNVGLKNYKPYRAQCIVQTGIDVCQFWMKEKIVTHTWSWDKKRTYGHPTSAFSSSSRQFEDNSSDPSRQSLRLLHNLVGSIQAPYEHLKGSSNIE